MKFWLEFLLLLIGLSGILVESQLTPFTCSNVTYVRTDTSSRSWTEAQSICRNFTATLPMLDTLDRQTCFLSAFKYFGFGSTITYVWLGASSSYEGPSTWRWLDGSIYNGTATQNLIGSSYQQSYAFITKDADFGSILYSSQATVTHPYICRYPTLDNSYCNNGTNQTAYIVNNSCIVKYNQSLSWFGARNKCLTNGGDLAIFPNASPPIGMIDSNKWWIGLRSSNWKWIDNVSGISKDMTFTQWAHNQPDGDGPQCISTNDIDTSNGQLTWRDYSCSDPSSVICQTGSIPMSTLLSLPPSSPSLSSPSMSSAPSSPSVSYPVTSSYETSWLLTNLWPSTNPSAETVSMNPGVPNQTVNGGDNGRAIALGVGIGVGVGLPIILLIIILIVLLFRRRRKSLHEGENSKQLHSDPKDTAFVQATGYGYTETSKAIENDSRDSTFRLSKAVSQIQENLSSTENKNAEEFSDTDHQKSEEFRGTEHQKSEEFGGTEYRNSEEFSDTEQHNSGEFSSPDFHNQEGYSTTAFQNPANRGNTDFEDAVEYSDTDQQISEEYSSPTTALYDTAEDVNTEFEDIAEYYSADQQNPGDYCSHTTEFQDPYDYNSTDVQNPTEYTSFQF